MKRQIVTVVLMGMFTLTVVSCGRTACRRICEWMEKCTGEVNDCEDECYDEYGDYDGDCRKAMRAFGRCVDDKSCEEVVDDCQDQAEDLLDDCEDEKHAAERTSIDDQRAIEQAVQRLVEPFVD